MNHSEESHLVVWTGVHALLMTSVSAATAAGMPIATGAWISALSFAALTYTARARWTPLGGYGIANAVTAFRLTLVCVLLSYGGRLPFLSFAAAVTVLLLDGLDGWLARRSGSSSAYGALLDKEVDAFFTLALCLVLYDNRRLGLWILIPGTLRYLFVLYIWFARPPTRQETATRWSRAMGAASLGGLILCQLPFGAWNPWLGGISTSLVLVSFANSFRQLYRE